MFWSLAERFDPDYFASATFTLGALRQVNPDWSAEWEQNRQEATDRDIPDASPEDRANLLEKMARRRGARSGSRRTSWLNSSSGRLRPSTESGQCATKVCMSRCCLGVARLGWAER